ncbi:MAG: hypothetical protein ACPHL6_13015, partial [Rubripirellula sp.]
MGGDSSLDALRRVPATGQPHTVGQVSNRFRTTRVVRPRSPPTKLASALAESKLGYTYLPGSTKAIS